MTNEDLLAQSGNIPTTYFDGFGAYRKVNGVLRCIGWTIDGGAQLNLIVSLIGADAANRENRRVLDLGEPTKSIAMWGPSSLAH